MKRPMLTAIAGLCAAWLVTLPSAPPLYDGLGFPDEPYRFVAPPAGYRHTPPPTTGGAHANLGPDGDIALLAATHELGPQCIAQFLTDHLKIDGPSNGATVTITPLAPGAQPADGSIWGNVYHIAIDASPGKFRGMKPAPANFIALRAPHAPPPAVTIEYNPGSGWQDLGAQKVGNDIYKAQAAGAGNYAIVIPNDKRRAATIPGAGSTSSPNKLLIVFGIGCGVAALFLALSIAVRLRRRPRTSASGRHSSGELVRRR